MTYLSTLNADLAAFGLLEEAAQADPRWMALLVHAYQQLETQRSMVDGFPDGILRVNLGGEILDVNRTARDMFRLPEGAQPRLRDVLPAEIEAGLMAAARQALETTAVHQLEFELTGLHFAQQFEARVCPAAGGGALIIVREITEQRWLQKARAFAESYFQSLLQRLNTGVLICTARGEIIIANDALLMMLNQRDEDLLGMSYLSLVPLIHCDVESRRALVQQFEAALSGRLSPQVTVRVSKPDLTGHIWLLVNASMEHDAASQTTQLKITFTDVTDFRNAEIALRESEEQYTDLMDRITDVIYHLDSDQEILFLNAAWPRLTGYAIEESLGCSILAFVQQDDRGAALKAFQARGASEVTDIEIQLLKSGGDLCWVSLRNQQVVAPDGTVIGSYGMMIDITDRKRSEAARAELTAKARTVELLTILLTNVSHDLRTPLSIIKLATFKAKRYWEQLDEARRAQAMAQIDEQVSRIMSFLEEYSDLARLDVDLTDFKPTVVLLSKLVESVVQKMRTSSPYQPRDWVIEADPDEIFIHGHLDWLTKMLRHLLDNAAQFSPINGRIVVRVHRQPAGVLLEIADNGIGIDPADQAHIFEPLYRADKARTTGSGLAGLGLTLVRRIVDAHGGEISIESDVGVGTTVRVRFPAP